MSALGELRRANERLDSGAEWYEQLLAVPLVFGLTIRTGVHVWTALIVNEWIRLGWVDREEIETELAGSDVSLASPVVGLRGHRADVVARYLTFCAGLGFWYLFTPLSNRVLAGQFYIVATVLVCVLDPIVWVVGQLGE